MNKWRCLVVVVLVIVGGSAYPFAMSTPASDPTSRDPNSVVPAQFVDNMEWSEQGHWHWVVYSYTGQNSTSGNENVPPSFVATLVRSLSADDPCDECIDLGENEQGPPVIMDGPENPSLAPAYANLDNGLRYKVASEDGESSEWAAGAWYLNYSPLSDRFFAWTWIPENTDNTEATEVLAATTDVEPETLEPESVEFEFADMGEVSTILPGSARVFPLAPGTYRLTQNFGCVAHNHGYHTSSSCPPDRPSFHHGTDWGASEGTAIYASASGIVTFADIDPASASGNSVIRIEHDGENSDYITEYLHWNKSFVQSGDHVYAGQPIAEVGSVGYSTGPHLHLTVLQAATGAAIDPVIWLQSSVAPLGLSIASDNPLVQNVLRWEPMIRASAAHHDVPAALIAAIITVESSGNPEAISPAGAQGLMQIMPMHFVRYQIASELWLDPATNIDSGARYLAETLSSGGTLQQAAARYFGHGCDVLGTCTEQYVARVMSWYSYYTALFSGGPLPEVVIPPPGIPASTTPQSPPATETPAPSVQPDEAVVDLIPEPDPVEEIIEVIDEQPAEEPADESGSGSITNEESDETPSDEPTPEPGQSEEDEQPIDEPSEESTPEPATDEEVEEQPADEPAPGSITNEEPVDESATDSASDEGTDSDATEAVEEQPVEEPTPESDATEEPVDVPSTEAEPNDEASEESTDEPTPESDLTDESGDGATSPEEDDGGPNSTIFGFGDVNAKVEEPEFNIEESTAPDEPDDDENSGMGETEYNDDDEITSYPIPQLL